ncbi:AAA family ATPase [uncultured Robinsoniella sp.]|uniref:AAA family ATPase n=1 Tax=uncultured Robinsoniella sp. TaxID=904190 RepID=UPI00374F20FD
MEIVQAASVLKTIKENINKVMIGKSEVIDLVLTALLSGGHILLEDVPGTGKTKLAKSLARSLDLPFSRIQFTPDLLPSDITGIHYYNQKQGEFVYREGPVFANIVLADEINRATPRTQSSLLECMEEKQVTVDGETMRLEEPFLVIATQNPIETAGTYPLPEAQLDRFLMQLSMGLPKESEELQMIERFIKGDPFDEIEPVCTKDTLLSMSQVHREVFVHTAVREYILALITRTRNHDKIKLGVSPRGTLAFVKAVQAYAVVQGRSYVVPEDVKVLAVPVMAHRVVMYGGINRTQNTVNTIKEILDQVPVPTENWEK